MKVDYIIAGQGICGTMLSYYLQKAGKQVLVIDESQPFTASRVASGVINPVTGRRVVTTWMIETLLPFCFDAYTEIGNAINESLIFKKNTITFSPSLQMDETYRKRMQETGSYIQELPDAVIWKDYFNSLFGCYLIAPTYLVNLHPLLKGWRKKLQHQQCLLEEIFIEEALSFAGNTVSYNGITADKIIFCSGITSFESAYWNKLPFVCNKGQALILDIPGLSHINMYKYGALSLVPWYDGLWWAGSSYENEFQTAEPTAVFREQLTTQLQHVLRIPFSVLDHVAAVRPATLERRPFVGLHPSDSRIGIFNGMGTKGCSLAPYFAKQFANQLVHGHLLEPLADVKRFSRVLAL
ncbi:FAD-binding oxidoreductase [Panacibacter sp. DH6]|uniref:FAD-binding oxidoreductase n=1 Tax=Panacibacter microcysteis TaxID=2793269 RepID=A0A931E7K9_9BACT|nr:FAD-binding oxidoreductase [Panacibacter microcysteis]MBG9376639.1 FAD-binding oxidoreductase [Panacibacter microcysteis]